MIVGLCGRHTGQSDAVLEGVQIVARRDDHRVDAEDGEAVLVGPAGILDQDQPAVTCCDLRSLSLVEPPGLVIPGCINERVERLRRYDQRISGVSNCV